VHFFTINTTNTCRDIKTNYYTATKKLAHTSTKSTSTNR